MRLFRRWTQTASLVVALSVVMTAVFSAGATVDSDAFLHTWMRTDKPVVDGEVNRTWMWGPMETAYEITESYVEGPGGQRQAMYFDKSRMEVTDPAGDPSSPWYVTNGLLATELITGEMQMGDTSFEQHAPAQVNVAGDADDPTGPTYATFNTMLDMPPADEGSLIIQRIDRNGMVTDDPNLAERGVTAGAYDEVTNHTVAQPFWDFMTSVGVVWEDEAFTIAPLFESYLFATGRPITEAYWAEVEVADHARAVLIQCFERRCLTYTPDNPDGWQVEAGNVGQHYHVWRYNAPIPAPDPTPTPPVGCVDINTASFDDLRRIIHIDEERAQAIIDLRPFSSVDDLARVSGIGEVRLQEIKDEGLACVNGDNGEPLPGDPDVGAQLFQDRGCIGCHSISGETELGPPLDGVYGSTSLLSDGTTVEVDEAYLRESILDPNAKRVSGYVVTMPTLPLSEQEVNDLVAYLMTLE